MSGRKRGGWKLVRHNRVRVMPGVHLNFGGGLMPKYTSTTVHLAKGVTWNSRGWLSIALGHGLKAVRRLGGRRK